MDFKKIKSLMEELKEDADSALIGTSIISLRDAQNLMSHTKSGNSTDKIDAVVAGFTAYLQETIQQTDLKTIGEYYSLTLTNNLFALAMPYKEYCWTMIFNLAELPMGMIMNIIVDQGLPKFHAAVDA